MSPEIRFTPPPRAKATNFRLCNSLYVVPQDLSVALDASLAAAFTSLSSSWHYCKLLSSTATENRMNQKIWEKALYKRFHADLKENQIGQYCARHRWWWIICLKWFVPRALITILSVKWSYLICPEGGNGAAHPAGIYVFIRTLFNLAVTSRQLLNCHCVIVMPIWWVGMNLHTPT